EAVEHGDAHAFKPWWDSSGPCRRNCSFVSGEVSAGMAMAAAAAALPAEVSGAAILLTWAFTGLIAFLRVAFGAHFLSDVVLAALLTHLVAIAMFAIVRDPSWRWGRRQPAGGDVLPARQAAASPLPPQADAVAGQRSEAA